MNKKYILAVSLLASLCMACKKFKETKDDSAGNLHLRGRVFYTDDILLAGTTKPLGKTLVKIGYPADNGINYLYSVISDADGYFLFENLAPSTDYFLFADSSIGEVKFSRNRIVNLTTSNDTASLTLIPATTGQNGFVYTVRDASGGLIKNCAVCAYSSFVLAAADTGFTCNGSTWQLQATNELGKTYKMNVPPADYVVLFKAAATNLTLKIRDTITVGINGIVRKNVIIR
jgi:hypothetical protein